MLKSSDLVHRLGVLFIDEPHKARAVMTRSRFVVLMSLQIESKILINATLTMDLRVEVQSLATQAAI